MDPLGAILDRLGLILGNLGLPWGKLGSMLGLKKVDKKAFKLTMVCAPNLFGALVGPCWGHLGARWGPSGAIVGLGTFVGDCSHVEATRGTEFSGAGVTAFPKEPEGG